LEHLPEAGCPLQRCWKGILWQTKSLGLRTSWAPSNTKILSSYDKVGSGRIQRLSFSTFTLITKVCGYKMLESKADPRIKLEIVLGLNPHFMHVSDLFASFSLRSMKKKKI